ncbi:MAG: MBL fold metallo-hydrolase [Flavobacteriia bacterium]|nr:MBL fold metallo-hydrolase [Flavobacteriia bacterium]
MKITKLTDDSSWLIETVDFTLVIDPWFTDQQVDGHPWFSLQKRDKTYGPFQFPKDKPLYIFVSHPFSDHCHKETLLTFPKNTQIVAEQRALEKIISWKYFENVLPLEQALFGVKQHTKPNLFNQTHHAFSFQLAGIHLLYAPHGIRANHAMPKAQGLITTTTTYKLPFFLGGTVNLGLEQARRALDETGASWALATHDQRKESKGLVGIFAKPTYEQDLAFRVLKAGESLSLAELV